MNTNLYKKFIAGFLAFTLLLPNSALAQLPFAALAPDINPADMPISIPADLGTVRDFHIPGAQQKSDKPFFIYIQDAHTNFEAQKSIKEILSYLTKEYGLKVIGVEGAVSPLEPNVLKFFKDHAKNARIAERLVKNGELSGVEWFAVDNASDELKMAGIEDADLYKNNLLAFRNLISRQPEAAQLMKNPDGSLQNLKGKYFSAGLLQFDRKIVKERGNIFSSVGFLKKQAEEKLKLDFNSIENQVKYPFFARLAYLMGAEKKLDLKKISLEKNLLVREMRGKAGNLSPDAVSLVSLLEAVTPGKAQDIDRSKYKSYGDFFEELYREGKDAGVNFSVYENFRRWASVLILQEEIQQEGLFEEIEQIVSLLYDAYALSNAEKEIVALGEDIEIARKLIGGELTRAEYEKIIKNPAGIEPVNLRNRMEAVVEGSRQKARENVSLLGSAEEWTRLKTFYDLAMTFYAGTLHRDKSMVANSFSLMKSAGVNRIAIVCGGFHTEGVAKLLKDQNAGYAIVTPRVKLEAEGNAKYYEAILESRKTIFDGSKIASIIKLVNDTVYAGQLQGNLANRNAVLGEGALVELVAGVQTVVNDAIKQNPSLMQIFPAIADQLATELINQINGWAAELSLNPITSRISIQVDKERGAISIDIAPNGQSAPVLVGVSSLATMPVIVNALDLSRAAAFQLAQAASLGQDLTDIRASELKRRWRAAIENSERMAQRMTAVQPVTRTDLAGLAEIQHFPEYEGEVVRTRPWHLTPADPARARMPYYPLSTEQTPATNGMLAEWNARRPERIAGKGYFGNEPWVIGVNNLPITENQFMLFPIEGREQRIRRHDIRAVLEILESVGDPEAVIGHNSINAGASLNSLHFHLFFGKTAGQIFPFFKNIKEGDLIKTGKTTVHSFNADNARYPVAGRVFSSADFDDLDRVVNAYLNALESVGVPFNLAVFQGKVYVIPVGIEDEGILEILGRHTFKNRAEAEAISAPDIQARYRRRSLGDDTFQPIDAAFEKELAIAASMGQEENLLDLRAATLKSRWDNTVSPRVEANFVGARIAHRYPNGAIYHMPNMPAQKSAERPLAVWERPENLSAGKELRPVYPFDPDGPNTDGLLADYRAKRRTKQPDLDRVIGEIKTSSGNTWFLGPNNDPILRWQTMVIPGKARAQRPLLDTANNYHDIRDIMEITDQIQDPNAVIGFNALNANASMNSLHFQLFFGLYDPATSETLPFAMFGNAQETPIQTIGTTTYSSLDNDQGPVLGRVFSGSDYAEVEKLVNAYLRILEDKDQGVPYSLMFRPGKVFVISWNQRRGPGLLVWGSEIVGPGQEAQLEKNEAQLLADWKKFMLVPEKHAEIDKTFVGLTASAQSLGDESTPYPPGSSMFFKALMAVDAQAPVAVAEKQAAIDLLRDAGVQDEDILFFSMISNPVPDLFHIYMRAEGEVSERNRAMARAVLEDEYGIPSETMDLFDTLRLKPIIDAEIKSGQIKVNVTGVIAHQELIPMINGYYEGLGEGTTMDGLHWDGFADISEALTPPRRWGGNAPSIFMGLEASLKNNEPQPGDPEKVVDLILLNPGFGSRLGFMTKVSASKGDVRFLGSRMILQGIEQAKIIAHFLPKGRWKIVVPADNIMLVASKVAQSFSADGQFYVFAKDDNIDVSNVEQADLGLLKKLTELGQYLLDSNGRIKPNGFVEKPHMFKLLRTVIRNGIQEAFRHPTLALSEQQIEESFYEKIFPLLSPELKTIVGERKIESLIDFFIIPQILGQSNRGFQIWQFMFSDLKNKHADEHPWISTMSEQGWTKFFGKAFEVPEANQTDLKGLIDQIRPFLKTYSNGFFFVMSEDAAKLLLSEDGYGHSYTFPGNGTFAKPTIPRPAPADLDVSQHIGEPMYTPTLAEWMKTPTPNSPSGKYTAKAKKLYPNPHDWELLWRIAAENISPRVGGMRPAIFGRFWADTGRILELIDFYKRAVNSSKNPMAIADRLLVRGLFGLPQFESTHNSVISGDVMFDDKNSYLITDSIIKVPQGVTLVLGEGVVIDGSYLDLTTGNYPAGSVIRIPDGTIIAGSMIQGKLSGSAAGSYIYHMNAQKGLNFDSLPKAKYEFIDDKGKATGTFILEKGRAVLSNGAGISVGDEIRISQTSDGKLQAFKGAQYLGFVNHNPVYVAGTMFVKQSVVEGTNLPSDEIVLGHNIIGFDPGSTEPIYARDSEGLILTDINLGQHVFGGPDVAIADYGKNFEFAANLRQRIRQETQEAQATAQSLGTEVANPSALFAAAEEYLTNRATPEAELALRLLDAGMDAESVKLMRTRREGKQEFQARVDSGKLQVIPVYVLPDRDMADDTAEILRNDHSGILGDMHFLTADWGSKSRPAGSKRGGNSSNIFAAIYKLFDKTLPNGQPNPDYLPPLTAEQIKQGVTRVIIVINNAGPGSRALGGSAAGVNKGDMRIGFATIANLALQAGLDFSLYFPPGEWVQVVSSDNPSLVSADVEQGLNMPGRQFFMFPYQARILPDIDDKGIADESTLPDFQDYQDLMQLGHALISPRLLVDGFAEKPKPLYNFLNILLSYHMAKMMEDRGRSGDIKTLKAHFFKEFAKVLHMSDPDSPVAHLLQKQKDYLQEHVFFNWLLPGPSGAKLWEIIYHESANMPYREDISLSQWKAMRTLAIDTIKETIRKYGPQEIRAFFGEFVERARYTNANTFFFAFSRQIAEEMVSPDTGFRNPFKEPGFGSPAIPVKRNFNLDWASIVQTMQVTSEAEALALYEKDPKLQANFPYREEGSRYPSDWMKNWQIMQHITQMAGGLSAAPFGQLWFDTGLIHTYYDIIQLLISTQDPVKRTLIRTLLNVSHTKSVHNSRIVEMKGDAAVREVNPNFRGESLIMNSIVRVPEGVTLIIEPGVVIDSSDLYLLPKPGQKTVVIPAGTEILHSRVRGEITSPAEAVKRTRMFYHYISERGLNFNEPGDVHVSIFLKPGKHTGNGSGLITLHHNMDEDPKKVTAINATTPDGQPVTGFTIDGKPDGAPGISWPKHIFADANQFPGTSSADIIQDAQHNNNWIMELEDYLVRNLSAPLEHLGVSAESLGQEEPNPFRGGIITLERVRELRENPEALAALTKGKQDENKVSSEGPFWSTARESFGDYYDRYAVQGGNGQIGKIWREIPKDPNELRVALEFYANHPELTVRYFALGLNETEARELTSTYLDYFRSVLGVKTITPERFQIVGIPMTKSGRPDMKMLQTQISRNFGLTKGEAGAVLISDDRTLLNDMAYLGTLYKVHEDDKKGALSLELEAALFAGNLKELAEKRRFDVHSIIEGRQLLSTELLARFLEIQQVAAQRIAVAA